MNKEDLRTLLNKPYQFENWKNVIDFVFPNVSYLQQPLTIQTDNEKVESFRQVGSLRLNDGKNLAIFEVHVKSNVNIARNRVELRNLVAGYIDQERNHGVLAIYEKGTDEYRFTYTAKETDYDEDKGTFVQKETEAKRFTYILGANETCRTARDRFWELSENKDKATIKDVENAFSVEKLSKEFFTKYKIQYNAFVDYLCNSTFKISAFKADEKAIRDFVKKMLGRIVFLHFVQKKGWLGASNAEYKDGDKQFMYRLWQNSKKNEAFYQLILVPLFFEALNENDRPDESFTFPDETTIRIPYLGGGLFEKDREDPDLLTFPPTLFNGLFEFFNEYNFTIDENDPHENEVGIDPEMLGQIFENLLEDNKDKGAFYTPKPIVKYMCQESLIQYLLTAFEKEGVITDEPEKLELEEKLGKLVKRYEANEVIEYDRILAKALYHVKICDPAIGSGAFPMGILNEMVMLINLLHDASPDVVNDRWEMDNWQPATVKKHIIQNSIYGVDIEKGAVDIARLRFWLSLIIDEEKPCNLPSLDYKIVVGNSLISKFEDEVIDIDWEVKEEDIQGNLFGDENEKARQKLLKDISKKQIDFYAAENHQKEKLELEIRNLKIDLLINQMQLQIKKKGLEKVPELSKGNTLKNQTEQYLKTQGWKQTITKLENLKKHPEKPFLHFDWKLDFPEILNPEIAGIYTGFDIVIGNPPYFVYENNHFHEIEDILQDPKYEIAKSGKLNAYKVFLALCPYLQKKDSGILCFIFQNSFLGDTAAKLLRRFYLEEQSILKIDSFPERDNVKKRVFESAKMSVCIFFSRNLKVNENYSFGLIVWDDTLKNIKSSCNLSKIEVKEFDINTYQFPMINDSEKSIFRKFYVSDQLLKISEVAPCYRGELNMTTERRYFTSVPNDYMAMKGAQIQRYGLTNTMSQGVIEYVLRDEYLNNNKGQKTRHHERPRIVTQRITGVNEKNRLKAAILVEGNFCADSCNYLFSIKEDLPNNLILAFLNSTLFNWIFKKTSTNSNVNGYEVDALSFPKSISKIISDKIQLIVSQILILKSENKVTTNLESQIDLIVYKLYELTYDEVLVVDPVFALTEQEYNDFSY